MSIFDSTTPLSGVRATESAHRQVELQSPADLTYLIANLSRAAREKLDKHFPPAASQGEEDAMRQRVAGLVEDYIAQTFTMAKSNLCINGLSDVEMETELARAEQGEEEIEPFDAKLAQRLQGLSAQIEAQTLALANLRRTAPDETARKWEDGFGKQGQELEEKMKAEEARRMEEAVNVDVSVVQGDRADEIERSLRLGQEGLGVLKQGMGGTVARLEKARMVVEVVEEKS
ncbi:hypothetical protein LTR62_008256 [Meristemomyces frigidus]|uniref:Kinetochore protein mis14 n=1 Tax=Meristemomyces frigidus TaxID=1508187 RepID=A0AAN7TAX6_9PEZI|nr:hypothetical protein LTR62_008256 [Meristemomyces frigidus]